MHTDPYEPLKSRVSFFTLAIKVLQELPRRLPISFYLILAIILMLLLGVKGFSQLNDPRQLAFTLAVFMIFFAAVIYRALIDAIDIARKHYREEGALLSDVFERDDFSQQLHQHLKQAEQTPPDSTDTPPSSER